MSLALGVVSSAPLAKLAVKNKKGTDLFDQGHVTRHAINFSFFAGMFFALWHVRFIGFTFSTQKYVDLHWFDLIDYYSYGNKIKKIRIAYVAHYLGRFSFF